jgi:putative phosphoesterase
MRTAIIADIHGNDVAFEAVMKDLKNHQINSVIFLGDLIAKGPQPQEVYDRMAHIKPLVWLKGNTDAWLDDALLSVLPTTEKEKRLLSYYNYMSHHLVGKSMDDIIKKKIMMVTHLGHYEVMCVHGTPKDVSSGIDLSINKEVMKKELSDVEATVILCAHTHKMMDGYLGAHRIINPGAIGLCNDSDDQRASYVVIDTSSGFQVEQYKVAYDIEKVIAIAVERDFPDVEIYETLLTKTYKG